MNCYIINQEPKAIELLSNHVVKTPDLRLIGSNANPKDALDRIGRSEVIADLTFLDADVLKQTDIGMAASITPYTNLIVSSAHSDFAATAFELDALDYLQAPFSYDRFLKSIDKAKDRLSRDSLSSLQNLPYFFVQSNGKGKLVRIVKTDIVFVESALNYLRIHLDRVSHLTYLLIREIEEVLSNREFVRVHKSFIINLDKVSSVEGNMIRMGNGKTIVLGPSYRKTFFERIGHVLLKSKR